MEGRMAQGLGTAFKVQFTIALIAAMTAVVGTGFLLLMQAKKAPASIQAPAK